MNQALIHQLNNFIKTNRLPSTFIDTIRQHYLPLAEWINSQRSKDRTWVVGINGAQGTGKSTLSAVLKIILKHDHNRNTAVISLDDLYLPREERTTLAQTVHPLLQTRGVPGTHDTTLGIELLDALSALQEQQSLPLPRFNKADDDRSPKENWPVFAGPTHVVIFEGWCMGASASPEAELAEPINELEASEDSEGLWRTYVNNKLGTDYKNLFARNDALIMLKAPDFASIHRWRWEQEQKLAATIEAGGLDANTTQVMDEKGIRRFIQHYERLTRQNLKQLPEQAHVLLELDSEHHIVHTRYKGFDDEH